MSGRRNGSAGGIHALGLDGHERTVLELPAWIVLMDVARDGRALLQVWALPLGIAAKVPGSGAEVELGWYDQSLVADLSPDGRLLLFAEVGESSQERSETYVRRTDGSPAVDLGPGTPLALSPDGAWALVGPAHGSESSLALVPTAAGDRRSLPAGRIEHYAEAYFFPDGERIAVRAREAGGRMRVWVQDIAGGDPRPISDEGIAWLMRPAAKGDAVPACRRDGSCALYPTAGGEHRPLPASRPGDRLLQVAPDGQSLVVIRPDGTRDWLVSDETALWKIDVATGEERLLHELDHCHRDTCDPVSLRLTPDASSYAYTYGMIESMIVLVEGLR